MSPFPKIPWGQRAAGTELVRYELLPEGTPMWPGDIHEEERATRICDLLERSGGCRVGEVLRRGPLEQKRLWLWATKDAGAFVTFDGGFLEAVTLLADGRAIVTTQILTKTDDAEKALLRHGKEIASSCERDGSPKPTKHDDGETWLAISEGLAPERARRDAVGLRVMLVGVLLGVPLALFLGLAGDYGFGTIIDLVFAGVIGGMMAGSIALFPLSVLWGELRMAVPVAPDRDEGPYRASGSRPHIRIAAHAIEEAPRQEPDEDEAADEDEDAEAKRRLDPPS